MKKSTNSAKAILTAAIEVLRAKQTWICFALMAILYLFSLFGGMFSSPPFTYAEF